MKGLAIGDRFPHIEAGAVDGSTFMLPDELEGLFVAVLFYRGHW